MYFFSFQVLGKVGEVIKIDSDGDVLVQFNANQKWLFNPACLTSASGQPVDDISIDADTESADDDGLSFLSDGKYGIINI